MLTRIAKIFFVVTLSGCASIIDVQVEKLRIRDQLMGAAKEVTACNDKLKVLSKYAPLYAKIALYAPPTSAQFSDQERPDEAMLQQGMDWYAEAQPCIQLGAEKFGRIDPELGAYMVNAMTDNVTLYQEFITTRPSYGYINTRLRQHREKRLAGAKAWYSNLDSRLKQMHSEQAAAAERQSAENKRVFMSALGIVTEVAANVLLTAVEVLAARQTALAQAQRQYVLVTPAYRPVRITNTSCSYTRTLLNCTQISY